MTRVMEGMHGARASRRRVVAGIGTALLAPSWGWAQALEGGAMDATPPAVSPTDPREDFWRARARAMEQIVGPAVGTPFAARPDDALLVMAGLAEIRWGRSASSAADGRGWTFVDLVLDLPNGSVVGQIYGLEVFAGDAGGLAGADWPFQGYISGEEEGDAPRVWAESPQVVVGTGSPATRARMRGDWPLWGAAPGRVAVGALVGELWVPGRPRTVLSGTVAVRENAGP